MKVTDFQKICFSIEYGILDSFFTRLWKLTTEIVLMQVNIGSDTPIFIYILSSLKESGTNDLQ